MVEPSSEPSEDRPANSPTSAATLYVDTENLRDSAQALIERAIESWPEQAPPVARLNLYVRADLVQLWDLWAGSQISTLDRDSSRDTALQRATDQELSRYGEGAGD